jgi:hypothetical protein
VRTAQCMYSVSSVSSSSRTSVRYIQTHLQSCMCFEAAMQITAVRRYCVLFLFRFDWTESVTYCTSTTTVRLVPSLDLSLHDFGERGRGLHVQGFKVGGQ